MDAVTVEAVKTLGIPVVGCLFLGYVIWNLARWAMKKGDELIALGAGLITTTTEEVKQINPKLDRIEQHVANNVCRAEETGRKAVRHA